MKLYKHQREIVTQSPNKIALVWETGTGKSYAAIGLANAKKEPTLYIVPKGLKPKWKRDLSTYSQVYTQIVTKEEFRKLYKELPRYDTVVVDEAHYFFGSPKKVQMARALHSYFKKHHVQHRYLLTATVYRSNPMDVYYMLQLLDRVPSYSSFTNTFFFSRQMYGRTFNVPRSGSRVAEELAAYARSAADIVKLQDCVDVPDQQFRLEMFTYHKEQKTELNKMQIEYMEPIVKYTQEHRICGGTLKAKGYEDDSTHVFHSKKIDRLLELVEENQKIIIVCRYNDEIEMLKDKLQGFTDRKIAYINGKVIGEDRQKILDNFKDCDSYILLVNAAVSEGWELHRCPFMVFYSYDFSLKNYLQMIGRIKRINDLHKNVYISLIVKDSIDEAVYKNIVEKKMDFHVAIYAEEHE